MTATRKTLLAATAIAPLSLGLGLVAGSAAWAQPPAGQQQTMPAPNSAANTAAGLATAAPVSKPAPVHASFTLSSGNGRVIHLQANATNVFTADPKVVEVRPASADSLFVFAVAPGATTVAALDSSGALIAQYQVTVVPSGYDAAQARAAISHQAQGSVAARQNETGVTLNGHVATPGDANRAVNATKASLPPDAKVDNELKVDEPLQVSLHVRIAEMTRTLTRELGVNWQAAGALGKGATFGIAGQTNTALQAATGVSPASLATTAGCAIGTASLTQCLGKGTKNFDLTNVIDALSQDQLVHVLAEPNLTAMSGQAASFLVGGEFPIPVANNTGANATISVEFKQYGISLAFVPTVVSHDRISLHVRPEVSQLDKANGVTSFVNGGLSISIPALTVRRADTTVELGSGQSFAIAGLLSDQTTQIDQSVPGLGDMPVLGALFRSESFQRGQTELVIIVTPYIVRPVNDPTALHLPTDGYRPPNDFERLILLRQTGRPTTAQGSGRIPTDAGFMVE